MSLFTVTLGEEGGDESIGTRVKLMYSVMSGPD